MYRTFLSMFFCLDYLSKLESGMALPSEGHNQMALLFLRRPHIMQNLPSEPDNTPFATSECGQHFRSWDGHCRT